ncbi:glycosyltransferase [Nodosilinea sp. AN01ver1]|uniref:glycosyltransferase n=1 Tax=Nodosilinea sp. AN01ver1 TaxID=3423362 RepID=UPI003D30F06E
MDKPVQDHLTPLNPTSKGILHLWIPNMFEFKGGIQVYSDFLLRAIRSTAIFKHSEVFLKHDRQVALSTEMWPNFRFHCFGGWPKALRTVAYAISLLLWGCLKRPQLIFTTHLNFIPVAYGLKRFLGIPYWTVAHGVDAWNIRAPLLKASLRHADLILAVSHYTRSRLLIEQNLDENQVVVLPNTFETKRFKIAAKSPVLLKRYQLHIEQPVILTVSRLSSSERHKGYDQIIKALPEIRRALPTIHYILVGKGSDRPRIEQMIAELDLQDCVTLAGFVSDNELCDHYNLCDVFAMPSKSEGFGIVYLEALACGKPTVGGNQDGAIDALRNGELGVLVDPENVKEIASTLIEILQGKSPHPILYKPEILREKVDATYGFPRFQANLSALLKEFDLAAS